MHYGIILQRDISIGTKAFNGELSLLGGYGWGLCDIPGIGDLMYNNQLFLRRVPISAFYFLAYPMCFASMWRISQGYKRDGNVLRNGIHGR